MEQARGGDAARLVTVPFGATATDSLAKMIAAAKGDDRLAPVTVIVPGNLTGLALRRELGGRGNGLFNVRFFVLDRLAELLGAGALAAEGRRPLDDAVKAALVRQVLASGPAPLAAVARAENTERAVVELLDEVAASGANAVEVLRGLSARGRSLASIIDHFRSKATNFYDERQLAESAARAIAAGAADLRDVGQVVLHLPHRLTAAQLSLVDVLADSHRLWAVIGLTGEAEADSESTGLVARLLGSLGSASLLPPGERPTTTVVCAPDAPGEVREAMRIIAAELEAGRPLHRIGVVYRQADPYARLLEEELESAGIPMHGPSVRTLAQTVAGRTLLGALALADEQFSRTAVVRWMSAAPIRFDGNRVRSARWARTARRAGVVRGADQWTDRLGRVAISDDRAAPLAEFIAWLVVECGAEDRASWVEWADWASGFLRLTLGSPAARRRWPEADLVSYDAVERVVEGLRSLAVVEPGPISRVAVLSHLTAMLAAPAGRRGSFGHGVLCGALRHVVGVDLDVLVVLGMAEGAFPPTGVSSAVLWRGEREAIGSPLAPDARARDERRTYLAATASAPTRFLMSPRASGGQVAHPSPWLVDEVRAHEIDISSFDAELAHPVGPPASVHEHDLRDLRRWPRAALTSHPLVSSSEWLTRGIDGIEARTSDAFSEWEGNVGAHEQLAISDRLLSATALQTWASCPAHYLFKNVLGVHEQDDVADVDELEARHRGSMVHLILERLGREHLNQLIAGADQLRLVFPGSGSWTVTARDAITEVTEEVFAEFELLGSAPYPILWEVDKRRMVRDVLRTLDSDEADAMLLAVEHKFGEGEGERPFVLQLDDGRELRFRGAIDRVDRLHDRLRVVDYKTGKDETEASVREGIAVGTLLQLPLYGLAAQAEFDPAAPVAAGYWYISSKGKWKRVFIPIDEQIRERFMQSLGLIASGIAGGVFPANPGKEDFHSFESCRYCDYDRICPSDRDRAWQRLQHAPALRGYLELSTPPPADGNDGE
jgi:ATP-dependent helicase/nuclease subunit B